jgi:N-acetylated-alpha-linked acidic dipeptidase
VFPGLVEAIDAKDYENAERWVGIIEGCLQKARKSLE